MENASLFRLGLEFAPLFSSGFMTLYSILRVTLPHSDAPFAELLPLKPSQWKKQFPRLLFQLK